MNRNVRSIGLTPRGFFVRDTDYARKLTILNDIKAAIEQQCAKTSNEMLIKVYELIANHAV